MATPRALAGPLVVGGAVLAALADVPSAAALAAGLAIALTLGNPFPGESRAVVRRLLPAAVVGLGGAMDLGAVARAGARGVGFTMVNLAVAAVLGALLARALRVDRRTGLLVTVGTAICGGSAIAAAGPVVGADDRQMSVALGTVFVLNAVALLVFPPIGHAASLGQTSFGLWAGLAIHDTSSVVGAALQYGREALETATTVKLARALWIVPLTLALGAIERRRGAARSDVPARRPWFILGFVAVAALATYVPGARPAGLLVAQVARHALVLTLFLIGLGLSRATLRSVGWRPLALGIALWVAIAAGTMVAIRTGMAAA
ncbi:MAG: YeiH family protein [Anaeromyxobacteraceae bacterium]